MSTKNVILWLSKGLRQIPVVNEISCSQENNHHERCTKKNQLFLIWPVTRLPVARFRASRRQMEVTSWHPWVPLLPSHSSTVLWTRTRSGLFSSWQKLFAHRFDSQTVGAHTITVPDLLHLWLESTARNDLHCLVFATLWKLLPLYNPYIFSSCGGNIFHPYMCAYRCLVDEWIMHVCKWSLIVENRSLVCWYDNNYALIKLI